MGNAPTVRIAFTFTDRDGNTADAHLYLPFTTPADEAFSFAYGCVPRFAAITDARITRIHIQYKHLVDDPAEPGSNANIRRKLLVFLRNGERLDTITVPSVDSDVFEQIGTYAGIRLDLQHTAALDLAARLQSGELDLRTEDDEQIGPELVTGGLAL